MRLGARSDVADAGAVGRGSPSITAHVLLTLKEFGSHLRTDGLPTAGYTRTAPRRLQPSLLESACRGIYPPRVEEAGLRHRLRPRQRRLRGTRVPRRTVRDRARR